VIQTTDTGAEFGDDLPLDEARKRQININEAKLLDLIDLTDLGLLAELATVDVGCITCSQREHISNISQPRERNRKLLGFLKRRSVANYNKFRDVLSKYRQQHLAEFLKTDRGEAI